MTAVDPHYAELVEVSVRLREAQHLLDDGRALHRLEMDGCDPQCAECGAESSWPCDTILAITPPAEHARLRMQAADGVIAAREVQARRTAVRTGIHKPEGYRVETVIDIEDVRHIISRTVKIGDVVRYVSPLHTGYVVNR